MNGHNRHTFINWLGSKGGLAKQLIRYIPQDWDEKTKRYYEVFLGSGALFLELKPRNAHLNDLNHHLISVWNSVWDDPNHFISKCQMLDDEWRTATIKNGKLPEKVYKQIRDKFNIYRKKYLHQTKEHLFLFLTAFAYGGMVRYDRSGRLSNTLNHFRLKRTPNSTWIKTHNIKRASQLLNTKTGSILLSSCDYKQVLLRAKRGDFVYLDPPYLNNFESYNDTLFNYQDFFTTLHDLDKKGVYWMMTNDDSKEVRKLIDPRWYIHMIVVVNTPLSQQKYQGKRYRTELVVTNYNKFKQLGQDQFDI